MIPGTEVLIGEDLIEGHSWAIDALLLNTDGVGLLNCVCIVYDSHLPTGSVHVTEKNQRLYERQVA